MDVAYLSALSALAGSAVGGLATGVTTWIGLRSQAMAGRLTMQLSRRQDLYRDFILAASKTYGDALVSNEPAVQELVALYATIARMRVLCAAETVAHAEQVMVAINDTYFAPNKTARELRDLARDGGIDPLRAFSEAARAELNGMVPL
jgi:hypothetical protein